MHGELPAWEAVYEPGNVSDYLIGYANDEAPAKAAAEAWLRTQRLEALGPLAWSPAPVLSAGDYDAWFELTETDTDGTATGPGLIVRHRRPEPDPQPDRYAAAASLVHDGLAQLAALAADTYDLAELRNLLDHLWLQPNQERSIVAALADVVQAAKDSLEAFEEPEAGQGAEWLDGAVADLVDRVGGEGIDRAKALVRTLI